VYTAAEQYYSHDRSNTAESRLHTLQCDAEQEQLLQNTVRLQPKGSCQEVKGSRTALKGTWLSSTRQLPNSKGQEGSLQENSPDGEILISSRRGSLAAHTCIHRRKTASCVHYLRPCLPQLLLRITCGLQRAPLLDIAADVTQHCW